MDTLNIIVDEISSVLLKVDRKQLEEVVNSISKDTRIFVDGEGRSGLMGKGFAMRLMHLGYSVYVVGETITPAVAKNDIYFAISGSGESGNVVLNTKKAKEKGCTIIAVTSKVQSSIASLAHKLIVVPGTTKGDNGEGRKSVQLLSSLFDQTIHIVLDALCLMLSKKDNISNNEATAKHW
ncbi:6-phospho-3-hexuloisomerase [Clostridium sp. CF012]|uniref:6-phospho-3-hexuloisomerase n=1 Tax=Clostridium sp. CF012 TaxID=2843319 RepID=UPI001C0E3286|nr:6-phospho-3-hexuloisomerase [Clostridium sp. CF012]MBU3142824.1 6-phospho-3-hexuloisomerase [Clostridium sp. CF012]